MNTYEITTTRDSIVIRWTDPDGEPRSAEYRADNPTREAARMRRVIERHLDNGGTMGNYQW